MFELEISTTKRCQMIDITKRLHSVINDHNIENGIMTVFVPHTTAAVTINENGDPEVRRDILFHLEKAVPKSDEFNHFEGNSDAHIKSSLMGASVQVIVENSEMRLGTWQSIYLCEFDGPRHRKVWVHIK